MGFFHEKWITTVCVLFSGIRSWDVPLWLCSSPQRGRFWSLCPSYWWIMCWLLFLTKPITRWLPVHVKDMVQLQHKHPEVLKEATLLFRKVRKRSRSPPKITVMSKRLALQKCFRCCKPVWHATDNEWACHGPKWVAAEIWSIMKRVLVTKGDLQRMFTLFSKYYVKKPFSLLNGCDLVSLYIYPRSDASRCCRDSVMFMN